MTADGGGARSTQAVVLALFVGAWPSAGMASSAFASVPSFPLAGAGRDNYAEVGLANSFGERFEPSSRQELASIVSRAVTLGPGAVHVHVEVESGRSLDIDLEDGLWLMDGRRVGATGPSGPLVESWRSLMGSANRLDHDGFREALVAWAPPASLDPGAADVATNLAEALATLFGGVPLSPNEEAAVTPSETEVDAELAEAEARYQARPNEGERLESVTTAQSAGGDGFFSYFGRFLSKLANLIATLFVLGMVAVGGSFATQLAPNRIAVIADVAKGLPGRSGMVGVMGGLLFLPALVIPIIALALTVLGALLVPVWVLGYLIAVAVAILAGILAVARNVGSWAIERRYPGTSWARSWSSLHVGIVGILALALFPVASKIVSLVPFFSGLGSAIANVGWILLAVVSSIGVGAVILTKGGSRYPNDWEDSDFRNDSTPEPHDP